MNPDQLLNGALEYLVFLFSTTAHEASHSYVALKGGDPTAAAGGQVSLNPVPHIRREPFGMVVLPLLSLMTSGGMIGWASAPYNPEWQRLYPKRAALMAAAGPAMNFLLSITAGIVLRIGMLNQWFERGSGEFVGTILQICFELNLLLGFFNMLPFPPFDGFGVLGALTGSFRSLENFRLRLRQYSFIGLLIGWQAIRYIYPSIQHFTERLFFSR